MAKKTVEARVGLGISPREVKERIPFAGAETAVELRFLFKTTGKSAESVTDTAKVFVGRDGILEAFSITDFAKLTHIFNSARRMYDVEMTLLESRKAPEKYPFREFPMIVGYRNPQAESQCFIVKEARPFSEGQIGEEKKASAWIQTGGRLVQIPLDTLQQALSGGGSLLKGYLGSLGRRATTLFNRGGGGEREGSITLDLPKVIESSPVSPPAEDQVGAPNGTTSLDLPDSI